jgi:acetyl esterase/lipase
MKRALKMFLSCLILVLACSICSLSGAADQNEKGKDMDREMLEAYKQASKLKDEKKMKEAVELLGRYDKAENASVKTRLQLANFKAWLYLTQLAEPENAYNEFLRTLDIVLPQGYFKSEDVAYGPHPRQKLDIFWPSKASAPTPLLVLIHGGGWLHGAQKYYPASSADLVRDILLNGGAVASITYRYSTDAKLPAPVHDAARAIQFMRANAGKYNLDKIHVVALGDSAGGATALWLATHDDLADPKAADPVLRESSRLSGAVANSAQTTLDPAQMKEWDNEDALAHTMFCRALGCGCNKEMFEKITELQPLIDEFSPVKHLDAGDPPIYLRYSGPISRRDGVHDSRFGLGFKKKADAVGATCILHISGEEAYPAPKGDLILKMLELNK